VFAKLIVDGLIQSPEFHIGFFNVDSNGFAPQVSTDREGLNFAVNQDCTCQESKFVNVFEYVLHGFFFHFEHHHFMFRHMFPGIEFCNKQHGGIRHVRRQRHILVHEIPFEIIQVVFFAMVIPALQVNQILNVIHVIVVGPVINEVQFSRKCGFEDVYHVEWQEPYAEFMALLFKDPFGFQHSGPEFFWLVMACTGKGRQHKGQDDALLQFQMADACDTHVVADDFPAELVDVPPHIH